MDFLLTGRDIKKVIGNSMPGLEMRLLVYILEVLGSLLHCIPMGIGSPARMEKGVNDERKEVEEA